MKVWIHDVAKALRESGGKPVKLVFQDGAQHIAFKDGHQENPARVERRQSGLSGKAFRRMVKDERRRVREAKAAGIPVALS